MSIKFCLFRGKALRFCQSGDIPEPGIHIIIAAGGVRQGTAAAVLYPGRGIREAAAAVFSQSIQRAVAEKAIEAVFVGVVAGEILTLPILKKRVAVIYHLCAPFPGNMIPPTGEKVNRWEKLCGKLPRRHIHILKKRVIFNIIFP